MKAGGQNGTLNKCAVFFFFLDSEDETFCAGHESHGIRLLLADGMSKLLDLFTNGKLQVEISISLRGKTLAEELAQLKTEIKGNFVNKGTIKIKIKIKNK